MKSLARKLYRRLVEIRRRLALRLVDSMVEAGSTGARGPSPLYFLGLWISQAAALAIVAGKFNLGAAWAGRRRRRLEIEAKYLQRLIRWADGPGPSAYAVYTANNRPTRRDLDRQRRLAKSRPDRPMLSILTPVFNAQPLWLERLVQSVKSQSYDRWELILVDDASTNSATRSALDAIERRDDRIRVERMTGNGGVSQATNRAAQIARGEFLALVDHDDELSPEALWQVARRLERDKDLDLIYSDEELVPEGEGEPYPAFKPGFSPELLTAFNYMCHLLVVRRSVFEAVGGLQSEFDGAQDFDLILRITERTDRVGHIPRILYRWHLTAGSQSRRADAPAGRLEQPTHLADVTRRAVQAHLDRKRIPAEAVIDGDWCRPKFHPTDQGKVSILIPTRDNPWRLWRAVQSVERRTDYPNYEIVILDDDSRTRLGRWVLRRLARRHRVVHLPRGGREFSFSRLINAGARSVDGKFLLLLNDDVRVQSVQWLSALVGTLATGEVGAVGAKLTTPHGHVQHAGVVLGAMGWGPWHAIMGEKSNDPALRWFVDFPHNATAVTGACLLTPRELFREVGGLDESLAVSFNDVDYCLRVQRAGRRVAYAPQASLIHEGGASRGSAVHPEEADRFYRQWFGHPDPYWNPNLSRDSHRLELDVRRRGRWRARRPARVLAAGSASSTGSPCPTMEDLVAALSRRGTCQIVCRAVNPTTPESFDDELSSGDFDVVVAQGPETVDVVEAAARLGVAAVWNLPGGLAEHFDGSRHGRRKFIRLLRALASAHQVVFNNPWSAAQANAGGSPPQTRMIPNCLWPPRRSSTGPGASFGKQQAAKSPRERIREALAIGSDKVVVLAVAPSGDGSDLELCVNAFERMRPASRRKAFLLLVGWGAFDHSCMQRLRRLARRLGESCCVLIEPGPIAEYCQAADVLLCHASSDPRPAAALEGLAAGLPLIAPLDMVHADLLHPDVNGLSAARFDAVGFGRALDRLVLDDTLRRRMGRAGRLSAQTRADVAWAIAQWELLIADAAEMTRQHRVYERGIGAIDGWTAADGDASHAPSVQRPAPTA